LSAIAPADPLKPHALIYIGSDETVLVSPSQPKQALDLLRLAADQNPDAKSEAWKRFDAMTKNGERMDQWQKLLSAAIRSITGRAEERVVDSLFTAGGTLGAGGNPGLDDWEVVSWLAILPNDG
jgi:hypothetical protein